MDYFANFIENSRDLRSFVGCPLRQQSWVRLYISNQGSQMLLEFERPCVARVERFSLNIESVGYWFYFVRAMQVGENAVDAEQALVAEAEGLDLFRVFAA